MLKKEVKKKKIWCFYKVNFSLLALSLILLSYFVVLVAMGPQSLQIVTDKIQNRLQQEFGSNSSIQNSYIKFTAYGSLRVSVIGLNIFYSSNNSDGKEFFTIPKLEAEFPIFNFLFLDFVPKKIKISNPLIIINDVTNLKSSKEEVLNSEEQLAIAFTMLEAINKESLIKNLEIENAKFILLKKDGKRKDILLKLAKIKSDFEDETLRISSENIINFDVNKNDVNFSANCNIGVLKEFNCDLFLDNFIPDSISTLHPKLQNLEKLSAAFDANMSLKVKDKILTNLLFKFSSSVGNINFDGFFDKQVDFKNLEISGNYDARLNILNISNIKSDFINFPSQFRKVDQNPNLLMSVIVSDLNLPQKKSEFNIKLENILVADLDKFWPANLKQFSSSKWVLENVKDGLVKNAYAKFLLTHDENTTLKEIDSKVVFDGVNLAYSPYFPAIKNIIGTANFSKSSMLINISNGDVLDGKISDSKVEINNFFAPKVLLDISGNLDGKALGIFAHINNSDAFVQKVEKNISGNASSKFKISLNLSDANFSLNSVALNVESKLRNIESKYVEGDVDLIVKKDFLSKRFIINADFAESKFTAKSFDITKEKSIESWLDLEVWLDGDNLKLKNISLNKNENNAKISGDLLFNLEPFSLKTINLRNRNFGKNYFNLSYEKIGKNNKLNINGRKLNFGALLAGKFFSNFSDDSDSFNFETNINLSRVELLNNKFLKQFKLNFDCNNGLCKTGRMTANYLEKENISLAISKELEKEFSSISGKISELGYLAEGFGFSNLIQGGDAEIKVKNIAKNKKATFEGEVEVNRDITIFENEKVKKFSKDNLFAKIKDKIFSSGKTTFDFVKIEFVLDDSLFELKSMVANNYKIGITGKGKFNLHQDSFEIKGMIVPGFLINNLFGIGNIPLIGGVISGVLTGGEGGGVFGLKYNYVKNKSDEEGQFSTNKVAAFVPSTLQNLFD